MTTLSIQGLKALSLADSGLKPSHYSGFLAYCMYHVQCATRFAGVGSGRMPLELNYLVGACLVTGDRIFATGSDSVSEIVLRSCGWFCLISGHTIMVCKGPRSQKHIAIIGVLRSYLLPLLLLLGRDSCVDRILRSCLQTGPGTAVANFAQFW